MRVSIVPTGREAFFPAPRHCVPGYYRSVPPGRDLFSDAFQALRTWLRLFCPSGTGSLLGRIPGTAYLATIILSLRDGISSRTDSRHCVPGYYHSVPSGTGSSLGRIPGTAYLATIILSLRDGIFSRTDSRHCVPGYYRSVPPGRDLLSDAFQALRAWLPSFCPSGTRSSLGRIPGTAYLATIVLSLRDGIFSRTDSRHYVPGYYRSVPTGRWHCVPGCDQKVPPGHKPVRPTDPGRPVYVSRRTTGFLPGNPRCRRFCGAPIESVQRFLR